MPVPACNVGQPRALPSAESSRRRDSLLSGRSSSRHPQRRFVNLSQRVVSIPIMRSPRHFTAQVFPVTSNAEKEPLVVATLLRHTQNSMASSTFSCTRCATMMYKPPQGGLFACPNCQQQFSIEKLPDSCVATNPPHATHTHARGARKPTHALRAHARTPRPPLKE